jgi:FixJ family two-component response regulator
MSEKRPQAVFPIDLGSLIMPEVPAVVFVIDDDPSMRAALEDLVVSVGLQVRPFASPQDFLQSKLPVSCWT